MVSTPDNHSGVAAWVGSRRSCNLQKSFLVLIFPPESAAADTLVRFCFALGQLVITFDSVSYRIIEFNTSTSRETIKVKVLQVIRRYAALL